MFHSDLLLRRRISFSPPQPPQPPAAAAVTAADDFSGSSSLAENHRFRGARGRSTRRQPEAHASSRAALFRQLAVHASARECACGHVPSSLATGLHTQGRPALSWCSIPPAVQPEPSFSTFWSFFASAVSFSSSSVASVHLQSASVHLQSYSLRFGSPFFFIFKLHSRDSPSY